VQFSHATPRTARQYHLPARRLHLRQDVLDVLLSCIPSEFLRNICPRGSPSTGTDRPAHVTLTELFRVDRDAMGNASNRRAPSRGIVHSINLDGPYDDGSVPVMTDRNTRGVTSSRWRLASVGRPANRSQVAVSRSVYCISCPRAQTVCRRLSEDDDQAPSGQPAACGGARIAR